MTRATGEIEQTAGGMNVPEIVRAAGKPAVRAYREFLEDERLSTNTRRVYGTHVRRFFRWAASGGLTLESINATEVAAYATKVEAVTSRDAACQYLTPVRGLFQHLIREGVCTGNPCGSSLPDLRRPRSDAHIPSISLSELKELLLEVDPTWEEEEEFLAAGLVFLAPSCIHTIDPSTISAFTGVALPDVQVFARRLLENRCWTADGRITVASDDPDTWSVSVIMSVLVATGMVEVKDEGAAAATLVGDETGHA
jgi:hypothetical protein